MRYTIADIVVEGIAYKQVLNFSLEQRIGEHAKCLLELELSGLVAAAASFFRTKICVRINKGDAPVLFYGVIVRYEKISDRDYPSYRFEAYSCSYLLDIQPKNATFQQTQKLIGDLIRQVAGGKANIYFGVTDRPIGSWAYQNQETDWKFIIRLASMCQAVVMTNVTTQTPVISIGRTGKHQTGPIQVIETYNTGGKTVYRTFTPMELGMMVFGGDCISYVRTFCLGGMIVSDYIASGRTEFTTTVQFNPATECIMLKGTVTEVQKEKVKVFFDSVDGEQDAASDTWFEYCTPYATGGGAFGSGFYCMPEVVDEVRVFIPSADESKAFAFGTVGSGQLSDPKIAQWKMPEGQELIFTKNGIVIDCGMSKVYINMKPGEGIKIWSNSTIAMDCQDRITLYGKDGVILHGENKLLLKSSQDMISVWEDQIVVNATAMKMN